VLLVQLNRLSFDGMVELLKIMKFDSGLQSTFKNCVAVHTKSLPTPAIMSLLSDKHQNSCIYANSYALSMGWWRNFNWLLKHTVKDSFNF